MKDYHIHSGFLDHTEDDLESIITAAENIGFKEIAITEHFIWPLIKHPKPISEKDHDTLFPEKSLIPKDGRKTIDLKTYFKHIEVLQKKFQVRILKGLEVDYFTEYEDEIKECITKYKIDIILGSCHYICDSLLPESNRYIHVGFINQLQPFINKYGEQKLYLVYFENILAAIKSGMFNYIAHLDFLKKKFKNYNFGKAVVYIRPILKELIKNNLGLEINLSGIKDIGETYPSRDVINEYIKMGGDKISIGSDAHSISRMKKSVYLIQDFEKIFKEFLS
ncbi:MAG: Histidinol-phosphatase [Syntrophomonadaceae bacterium]|nr:Histidinol-phosphatase [Bacillota bacterium]